MSDTKVSLPEFKKPPLIEVALSVQFNEISKFSTPYQALLWESFRSNFPRVEEHPPIDPVIETYGIRASPVQKTRVQIFEKPPIPRLWFLNEQGSELVQIQNNRFIHNWRKLDDKDEYPRYPKISQKFKAELDIFQDFLSIENLDMFEPTQVEVTYVNHIHPNKVWNEHTDLGKIFTVWSNTYIDDFLNDPEDVRFAARYLIKDSAGEFLGRLHIKVEPAFSKSDRRPIFVTTLTARGHPTSEGMDGIFGFLDLGHEYIVRGFTSITTREMHKIWERNKDEK